MILRTREPPGWERSHYGLLVPGVRHRPYTPCYGRGIQAATRVGSRSGLADGSGTTVTTSASIAVQVGDAVGLGCGWEGGTTTCTPSASISIGTWASLGSVLVHSNADLCLQGHYVIATSAQTVTFTATLGAARTFKRVFVEIFRPAASTTLALDTGSGAPVQAQGSSGTPSAGSLTAGGAGGAFVYVKEYSAVTYTQGTGWTEDIDNASYLEYRLPTGSGSITGNCTSSGSMDWGAVMAHFLESGGGGATIYNRRPFDSPVFQSRVIR